MSAPTTFVETIERLRDSRSLNLELAESLRTILRTSGGTSSERQIVAELAKAFDRTGEEMQELSIGLAQLAMANSKEDFDKIIAAVAK
jgi:hypothetical protein